MTGKPRVIYWFRTDLRLHDSPALKAALDLKPECLYPVWCWDPHYVYRARVGPNRWQYLLDCQSDLSKSITKLNSKSKLFVVREAPQTVLPKLFNAWKISHLVFEKDTDAYARERDEKVMELAREAGVKVIVKMGRTLYDPDELVKANGGKPTMSITQVEHAAKKLGDIPRPIPAPKSLPDPGDTTLDIPQERPSQEPDINAPQRSEPETSYTNLAGPDGTFSVPTFSELGLKPATTPHRGGETLALSTLDSIIANESYTATFSKPSTAPTAFSPQSTTLLSPTTTSAPSPSASSTGARTTPWKPTAAKANNPPRSPPTSSANCSSETFGNSHCRFVPWHLPSTTSPTNGFITGKYTITSALHETWYQRWKYGRTGFPWIDALMRQLRREGWIHHLGRHAVACFLTRGGCYIDWERGAEVFEEWLLDHETACNSGNWQWLACVAFYAQFYRCYSPVAFPKKTDKSGAFVRRYVPELARFPEKFIYEPWRAPIADQKAAGCLVKGDGRGGGGGGGGAGGRGGGGKGEGGMKIYPKPMFDFNARRGICIEGVKSAYHVNLYGDDEKVKDGSWRELFPDGAEGPTEGVGVGGGLVQGEDGGGLVQGADGVGEKEKLEEGALNDEGAPPDKSNKKRDLGLDEDEREARALGGETKGGDRSAGKRKRQGTLDGAFARRGKRGKKM
ncbi:cryptochrome-2 [Physcia stellaris]|nr:cryptochrome-2 [Physcia stellaris]